MRKLILQMQTSLDMFICDQTGSTEGFVWNWEPDWKWDGQLQAEFIGLKQSIDCVLLSRKMAAEGFIDYWHSIAIDQANPASQFARAIDAANKVVFSKTAQVSAWPNTVFATAGLAETIHDLKRQAGKHIIAYGGAGFASALLGADLIDELILYVNPIAFGSGTSLFESAAGKNRFELMDARAYPCGMAVLKYKRPAAGMAD